MRNVSDIQLLSQNQLEIYFKVLELKLADQERLTPLAFLALLHKQHTLKIAFSTMSYHEGSELSPFKPGQQMNDFSVEQMFERILINKKGGTCASLNMLFASLLKTLGYEVYAQKGKVMWGHDYKRPAAHRFSTVKVGGQVYLIDVGFGGPGPRDILQMYDDDGNLNTSIQGEGLFQYKFEIDEEGDIVLQHRHKMKWLPVYAFEFSRTFMEEEYRNQSSKVNEGIAGFRSQRFFATRPTSAGRIRMMDKGLSYRRLINGNYTETTCEVTSQDLFIRSMNRFFGLNYSGPFKAKGKVNFDTDSVSEEQENAVDAMWRLLHN